MAKTLKTPETFTAEVNGITFSFEFKLTQSRERDWAPYDQIMCMIKDDAGMIVKIAETTTVAKLLRWTKDMTPFLTRNEASLEILAKRAQMSLFA